MSIKPLLLDLYCCEGGSAWGWHLAGFRVVGVDKDPQPRYPFEFHQADADSYAGGILEAPTSKLALNSQYGKGPRMHFRVYILTDYPRLSGQTKFVWNLPATVDGEHITELGLECEHGPLLIFPFTLDGRHYVRREPLDD